MKGWLVALLLVSAGVGGCKRKSDPANDDGAKDVLSAFVKPGADHAALTAALRPKPEDYEAVFVGDAAQKVKGALEPVWESGKPVLKPQPDQTEVVVGGVTPEQLAKADADTGLCPKGYKDIADKLNAKVVVYCGRFVKPGDKLGMVVDGLVHVNGHWAIFPKAFRALSK